MSDASFKDFVLEQLEAAKGLKTRAMFGGHGLYIGASFFGIVHKGSLYFRTDEASRPAYVKAGSRPFNPKGRIELHRYYEVPSEVLEDAEELLVWAKRATKTRDE
jgi:DNA transformation protein